LKKHLTQAVGRTQKQDTKRDPNSKTGRLEHGYR
jgi:hypothetical protein